MKELTNKPTENIRRFFCRLAHLPVARSKFRLGSLKGRQGTIFVGFKSHRL